MIFLDREQEIRRLERLAAHPAGGLVVLHGRRRLGKTRLLLEWAGRGEGLYTVADQSAPDIQRSYLAEAISARIPGFADVDYPSWSSLLARLAREAALARWRGPVILDELPYLVLSSPELPSVLQRWIDHDAAGSRLVVALAGSSQRMMQGLALSADAPLYGRAREILEIMPLDSRFLPEALGCAPGLALLEHYTAWGGVPRYWELAAELAGGVPGRIDDLVLDPLGVLHREPDRLLLEEVPTALEVRPVLDAIGAGAHRVSEIAGRLGRPATSLSRPLKRLVDMGLARRETPFGESERRSRRALYRIADPFVRLWFRVVAPHRGQLASSPRAGRLAVLRRHWSELRAQAWEELCRARIPLIGGSGPLGCLGPWLPASRWWRGNAPEWDVVSESADGRRLLLGECKASARPLAPRSVDVALRRLRTRPPPSLPARFAGLEIVRALFVPECVTRPEPPDAVLVVTCADLVGAHP